MEDAKRKEFMSFLSTQASKCKPTGGERRAYLYLVKEQGPYGPRSSLLSLSAEDVVEVMDKEEPLPRELLRQLHTYDPFEQKIIGMVWDEKTVLSEVLWQDARKKRKVAGEEDEGQRGKEEDTTLLES